MANGINFYRLKMLIDFETAVNRERKKLLDELIDRATDPVIYMRRFRMLSQLSNYESQTIAKIHALESDDETDFLSDEYILGLKVVLDKNG